MYSSKMVLLFLFLQVGLCTLIFSLKYVFIGIQYDLPFYGSFVLPVNSNDYCFVQRQTKPFMTDFVHMFLYVPWNVIEDPT